EGAYRAEPEDVVRIKTRNNSDGMVPLGSVVTLQWRSGSDRIVRYNMFPAAEVNGDAAPGESQGTALAAMERLAAQVLPLGMQVEWTDIAYQAKLAGNTAVFIFPLCVLFVFLVHSAEYESWSLALAIILIAPMCLPFALFGTWLRSLDNNLITQIGFITLIGLAAKNAVLIVEFAKQQQEEGKDRFAAAVEEALRGSHDLRAAAARVEQARNQIAVARADMFPQVSYQGEAVRERAFVPGRPANATFDSFLGTFNLAWEIDVWGRIRRATESARADYLAAEAA